MFATAQSSPTSCGDDEERWLFPSRSCVRHRTDGVQQDRRPSRIASGEARFFCVVECLSRKSAMPETANAPALAAGNAYGTVRAARPEARLKAEALQQAIL